MAAEGSILNVSELEEAVELQQRSYELLKWLSDAIPRGFVSFETAHDYVSSCDSALAWIGEHFDNLPPRGRPPSRQPHAMRRFANVFSSYLDVSFDLVEEPGTVLVSHCGCYCAFCLVLAKAPHLRPKRLRSADKARAQELEQASLAALAASRGLELSPVASERLLKSRNVREQAALLAYATELLRRCDGVYTGPWVLALWRTFAWTEKGSPKPDFRLRVELITDAERRLVETVRTAVFAMA
jgi:hypothetical protein